MNIDSKQISSKREIGKIKGKPVYEITLTGGLNLVVFAKSGGGVEIAGSGPHVAVARYIARKRNPEMELTELSKSDWIDPEDFSWMLPKYERITNELNEVLISGE